MELKITKQTKNFKNLASEIFFQMSLSHDSYMRYKERAKNSNTIQDFQVYDTWSRESFLEYNILYQVAREFYTETEIEDELKKYR